MNHKMAGSGLAVLVAATVAAAILMAILGQCGQPSGRLLPQRLLPQRLPTWPAGTTAKEGTLLHSLLHLLQSSSAVVPVEEMPEMPAPPEPDLPSPAGDDFELPPLDWERLPKSFDLPNSPRTDRLLARL